MLSNTYPKEIILHC